MLLAHAGCAMRRVLPAKAASAVAWFAFAVLVSFLLVYRQTLSPGWANAQPEWGGTHMTARLLAVAVVIALADAVTRHFDTRSNTSSQPGFRSPVPRLIPGLDGAFREPARLVVAKGFERQVVAYRCQDRDGVVASEYRQRVHTVLRAIRAGRTDAAFVRIIAVRGVDSNAVRAASVIALRFAAVAYPAVAR
jgi:hypothetical protein